MSLISDWKAILKRAWSIKLTLAAGLVSAVDAGVSYYLTGSPPLVSIGAALLSFGAAIARVIAQPELNPREEEEHDPWAV